MKQLARLPTPARSGEPIDCTPGSPRHRPARRPGFLQNGARRSSKRLGLPRIGRVHCRPCGGADQTLGEQPDHLQAQKHELYRPMHETSPLSTEMSSLHRLSTSVSTNIIFWVLLTAVVAGRASWFVHYLVLFRKDLRMAIRGGIVELAAPANASLLLGPLLGRREGTQLTLMIRESGTYIGFSALAFALCSTVTDLSGGCWSWVAVIAACVVAGREVAESVIYHWRTDGQMNTP